MNSSLSPSPDVASFRTDIKSCGIFLQGVCTEAGMYALRERRVHVTQEDFEMAVAKVMQKDSEKNMSIKKLWK